MEPSCKDDEQPDVLLQVWCDRVGLAGVLGSGRNPCFSPHGPEEPGHPGDRAGARRQCTIRVKPLPPEVGGNEQHVWNNPSRLSLCHVQTQHEQLRLLPGQRAGVVVLGRGGLPRREGRAHPGA